MRITDLLIQAVGIVLVLCLLPFIISMGLFALMAFISMTVLLTLVGGVVYLVILAMNGVTNLVQWVKRIFKPRKKS